MIGKVLVHNIEKYFLPKFSEAKQELAQKDTAKASNEILQIQKQGLVVEKDILSRFEKLQISNQISIDTFESIKKDIGNLNESFKIFAIKSFDELQEINRNVKHGLNDINSSVLLVNNSIVNSSNRIISQITLLQKELLYVLSNPGEVISGEKRKKAREQMEQAYSSVKFKEENLAEAIALYVSSLKHEIGRYDGLAWLELGFAYSFVNEIDYAKIAFTNAIRYSEIGRKNILLKIDALINLIEINIFQKEFEEGYKNVKEALSHDPQNASLLVQKGILEVCLDLKEPAIKSFRLALNLNPESFHKILNTDDNLIPGDFIEKLTRVIKTEERIKLKEEYLNFLKLKKAFESIWTKDSTNELIQIVNKINKVMELQNNADISSIIDLKGWNFEANALLSNLTDKTEEILKNESSQNEKNIQDKKGEIEKLEYLEADEIRRENKDAVYQLEMAKKNKYLRPRYSEYIEKFNDLKKVFPILLVAVWFVYIVTETEPEELFFAKVVGLIILGGIVYLLGLGVSHILKWIIPLYFYFYDFYINEAETKKAFEMDIKEQIKSLKTQIENREKDIKAKRINERKRLSSELTSLSQERDILNQMKRQMDEIRKRE
ncbi:tetratricopeptide repeat protein [Haliscomenobacter sp.]|uniref:tetratricopeptide repeat protein n=1 Tax=Haliscomenobacter sp. TaxID=2717303 RepID=UPI003BA8C5F7